MDGHGLPADVRRWSPPRRTHRRPPAQASGLHDGHVRVHGRLAGQRVRLQCKRDRPCPRRTGGRRRADDARRTVPDHDHLLRRTALQGAHAVGRRRWTRHRRRRGRGRRPHHLGGMAVHLLGQRPDRGDRAGRCDQGPAPARHDPGPTRQVRPGRRRDCRRRTGRADVRPCRSPQPRLVLGTHDHGARRLGRPPLRVRRGRTPGRTAPRPPAHVVDPLAGLGHRRHAGHHRCPGRRGLPRLDLRPDRARVHSTAGRAVLPAARPRTGRRHPCRRPT